MKLIVRGIFFSACVLAGVLLAGCGTTPTGDFASGPTNSLDTPLTNTSPVADVARFQVGDTVIVSFSGLPNDDPMQTQTHAETIKEDGTIGLPYIGAVVAAGKTPGEIQNEIHDLYVPKYYLNLTVSVSSGDRVYYVSGEIKGDGRVLYVDGSTVTKAIQSAGGLTDFASHKVWLIRAANGQRIQVDYDEALRNPAEDPPVYPNDQINVPRRLW
ncbi:MAG TPA: polysaccharide biosynthesis/export family protein [Verrucomicrobiae bacterium]|nr:polysaccharide biosynthesis/export family protein [Verrucomicrobiae bacterium]